MTEYPRHNRRRHGMTYPTRTRHRLYGMLLTLAALLAIMVAAADDADAAVDCNAYQDKDRAWFKVWYDVPFPGDNKTKELQASVTVKYRYCIETIYVGGIPRKTDWVVPTVVKLHWHVMGGESIPCGATLLGFNGLRMDPWIGSNEKQQLTGDQDWRVPCEGDKDTGTTRDHILQDVKYYPPGWPQWNSTCRVNYNNREDEDCNHIVNPGEKLKFTGVLAPIV